MYRPTTSSIWNSFQSSGKRHLILTGGQSAGKTFRLDPLRTGMPGIITRAVPKTGVYIEAYPHGQTAQIGVYDPALPGERNKMRICADGFDNHAIPMVRKLAAGTAEWVFADEIGYLESDCPAYMDALRNLFDRKRVIAAVRKQDTPFLLELRARDDVFCVDLDAPFGNTACVIMASGMSRRFGGNKLLAEFHGKPMIRRVLSATEGIFHRRVVVTRHPEVAELCGEAGVDAVLHDLPYRSDTVRLGLEAVGEVDGCLFCAADQPLLRRETVASIVMVAAQDPGSIWRPCYQDEPGAPVLFPRRAFPELLALPQGKGGGYVARMHPEWVRTLPVHDPWELVDADDRERLDKLLEMDAGRE